MESLPEEMRTLICQYLAGADLARCCAVSRSWREMFGHDGLWRVHCDETLPEYLDVNNCVVKPHFTSPEIEDSTLSAISEWRLNYMKEIHLRNNWCLGGRVKTEKLVSTRNLQQSLTEFFFKNHYLLLFKQSELEVWDLRKNAKFIFEVPLHVNPHFPFNVSVVNGTDKFVTVQGLAVLVYSLCCTTYQLQLMHVFSFEMSEKFSGNTEEAAQELLTKQSNSAVADYVLVGNVLVGFTIKRSPLKMHVWNVETGHKLKEEECPFLVSIGSICQSPRQKYSFLDGLGSVYKKTCEKMMNIAFEVLDADEGGEEEQEGECKFLLHHYVYSLTELMFLPFHDVKILQDVSMPFVSIIFDRFIAIGVDDTVRVYNYFTSELMYTAPYDGTGLKRFGNYVMFEHNKTLHAVNLYMRVHSEKVDVKLPYDFHTVSAVGNKALLSSLTRRKGIAITCTDMRVKVGSNSMSAPLCQVTSFDYPFVNQAGTKMLLYCGKSVLKLAHFW